MDALGWNEDNAKSNFPVLIVGLTVFALVCTAYKLALPKPLPGLPYNKEATSHLFGDAVQIRKEKYRRQWMWSQPAKHGAPLSQLFLFPFRRPFVIVTDYYAAVALLSRPTKEFDRSYRQKEIIGYTAPNFHFCLQSQDPRFSYHKSLVRDLMTPRFLHEVSAPQIYEKVKDLVALWNFKAEKACGRPFTADQDLYMATLETICSVAFLLEAEKSPLSQQLSHLQSLNLEPSPRNVDEPFTFPTGPTDPDVEALRELPDIISLAQSSPMPTLAQTIRLLNPKHARAQWRRRALIRRQVGRSLQKLAVTGPSGCESALDQLLWREMDAAQKAGREPNYYRPEIRDETLGYLLAGHDTLATVTSYWIKFMTRHQTMQGRLQREVRQAHATASEEGRWPTKDEICNASIPYFDAVIEETLRCCAVATLTVRLALCDTQILGYPIPKGTDVLISLTGPSVTEPALTSAPEKSDSPDDNRSGNTVPYWGDDIREFKPERWLKTATDPSTGKVKEVYDANAGPNLAFSAGTRACFGKRLAYIQLKIMMTLLLWNFEFEPMDDALNCDEVVEKLVNMPKQCYAKLKKL